MKLISIIIILTALLTVAAGCGNDQYQIEKQYWQAQRQAEKIFRNPAASPPRELQRVVNLLNGFAQKFPKNILAIEADFNVARLFIVKEEYEKGRAQLKSLISKYTKFKDVCAEARFLLGNSYEIENKWPSALAEYQKIMQVYPMTRRGLNLPIYIAQHYRVKYQPDKMMEAFQVAIEHYKSLSAKYPRTLLALNADTLIAQCYLEIKDWQDAINAFNTIIEKYKIDNINMDRFLLNIALIYNQQLKDQAKAIETLQKLIKEYPKSNLIKPATELLKEWSKK